MASRITTGAAATQALGALGHAAGLPTFAPDPLGRPDGSASDVAREEALRRMAEGGDDEEDEE